MSKVQLRGKKLQEHIHECLKSLAADAKAQGKEYKYNASELQRVSGVSRVSLNKYEEFIDYVLEEVEATKKIEHGQAGIQHLLERIERLEEENRQLSSEATALREQHVRIFDTLYSQSIDAALLIKAETDKEANISSVARMDDYRNE